MTAREQLAAIRQELETNHVNPRSRIYAILDGPLEDEAPPVVTGRLGHGLACIACRRFLSVKKTGVWIEEGMPHKMDQLTGEYVWGPYKLWAADLWECRGCGYTLATGFGRNPLREHFQPDYAAMRERVQPLVRIDDCGQGKPA